MTARNGDTASRSPAPRNTAPQTTAPSDAEQPQTEQAPTPNTGELTQSRRLGQGIHAFSNMISGFYYGRTEVPFGVSLPEWRVLRCVMLAPGTSQNAVAQVEGLNVMNVSRAVAGLRRKKLITAEPDPDDRRKTKLQATDIGEEVGADIARREQLVYDAVFAVLSPAEMNQFENMLERVNEGLRSNELPQPTRPSRDWAETLRAQAE